jgi:hypothetical protein
VREAIIDTHKIQRNDFFAAEEEQQGEKGEKNKR